MTVPLLGQSLANIYIPQKPDDTDMRPGGPSCIGKSLIDKVVSLITKLELWVALKGTALRFKDSTESKSNGKAVVKITSHHQI